MIGHAALRKSETSGVYDVSYIYLLPLYRGQGYGGQVIEFLTQVASNELNARGLNLVVRTYNPQAMTCYSKSRFIEVSRDGTLVNMSKIL